MTAAAAATNVITNGGIRPADMFLTRALEKMLADKEIKKSQNSQLKKQFELALSNFVFLVVVVILYIKFEFNLFNVK